MGLSSNQARFLSITARKCDLEFRMQQICNKRLRLANELQNAATTYDDKTSDRKLFLRNINTDSLQASSEYDPVSVANLGNDGYYVMDTGADGKSSEVMGAYGSGTVFEVKTADDLTTALKNSTKDSKIILENDLNLTGSNFSTTSNFAGTFYANGKNVTTDKALFDNISTGAAIYDMNLKAAAGTTLTSGKGLLANSNAGTIDNVVVSGNISAAGSSNVGGIVASNFGAISNASSAANISGTSGIAGIAASNSGTITNAYSTGSISGANSGGIVGSNAGTITTANSSSAVTGNYSGGIVGSNSGTITAANSSGTITGNYSGGIAGTNTATGDLKTVTATQNSHVNGDYSGGIVGTNYGDVDHSTAIGTVSGSTTDGAIAGQNSGIIETALAGGSVASTNAGGIAGANNSGGTIKDTYVISTVSGTNSGSVAGTNSGSIDASNVFVSGETTKTNSVGTGSSSAQGIAILSNDTIASPLTSSLSSDWTKPGVPGLPTVNDIPVTISETTNPNGGTATKAITSVTQSDTTALTDSDRAGLAPNEQLMYDKLKLVKGATSDNDLQIVKYMAAVPDGSGGYVQKENVALAIKSNAGLVAMDGAANSGTASIKTAALSSNYLMMLDATLTGSNNWKSIGGASNNATPYTGGSTNLYNTYDNAFTGTFDGNSHSITGLNITQSGDATYQGLFGNVGQGGSVVRTTLTNATISIAGKAEAPASDTAARAAAGGVGAGGYVGGIAGLNNGTVENCDVQNITISVGDDGKQIGGLVGGSGRNNNSSIVNKSSSSGTITVNGGNAAQIGGLVGWLQGGATTLSSSSVNINGSTLDTTYISGLVGDLDSSVVPSINYCYATGLINGSTESNMNIAEAVNHSVIENSYYKNGSALGVYTSTPSVGHTSTSVADYNTLMGATTTVNGASVPIWDTTTGKLNIAASNTVTYNYSTYDVTGETAPTQTAKINSAPTTTTAARALPTYTSDDIYTTKTKGLAPGISLEEGLRSGRYQLLINSDMQTQNPVTGSNSGNTTFEKVDWRTQSIISDELDTSNDAEAQTTYDRVVRDTDEQDKLLQMEQEKINTEYQALTSEKDAVKKILDTNAQGSFKYFS